MLHLQKAVILARASEVALLVKNPPATAGDARDLGSIPGLGRSPGEERGNPLQCSCLENPTDRGAWRIIVYRVPRSRTWLSTHTCDHCVTQDFFQLWDRKKAKQISSHKELLTHEMEDSGGFLSIGGSGSWAILSQSSFSSSLASSFLWQLFSLAGSSNVMTRWPATTTTSPSALFANTKEIIVFF